MGPRIPETPRPKSTRDYVLQPYFSLLRLLSSPTPVRLSFALFVLLPLYALVQTLSVLPSILGNLPLLFSAAGRSELCRQADSHRRKEEHQARQQLNGTFRFQQAQLVSARKHAIRHEASWYPNIEDFEVCGARVNVVVERPVDGGREGGMTVVLLHGNPSWSFMWREIIPLLTRAGHTVYAPDFLGHGLSDKPTDPSTISFELHMRTLISLFEHFDIHSAAIIAHDWGGCIAASAAPYLPTSTSPRLLFLNSFLPPRPRDISWNALSLYLIWFLSTGILAGHIPEGFVMRYMSPIGATRQVVQGYAAPYAFGGIGTKASVSRFAHLVPFLPDVFYAALRNRPAWRILEGLCGPQMFTNLTAQAGLAERNTSVRAYWKSCYRDGWKVGVVFGAEDPLLGDFKDVLEETVSKAALWEEREEGCWVEGAGHYPVEERAVSVARTVLRFLAETDRRPPAVGG